MAKFTQRNMAAGTKSGPGDEVKKLKEARKSGAKVEYVDPNKPIYMKMGKYGISEEVKRGTKGSQALTPAEAAAQKKIADAKKEEMRIKLKQFKAGLPQTGKE